MIVVSEVSKSFNHVQALQDVSFHVRRGESFALLGPNGAGKTTLVRIISALLKPSSGTVRLNGVDVDADPVEAKRQIGVVSHNPYLYDELTAWENLEFFAGLFGREVDVKELLGEVGLGHRAHDQVGTFSRGMKQRLSIARAILHDPVILIFDEPTAGLDVSSRRSFYELVRSLWARGKTILLTTHYLDEARTLCKRGVVLRNGRIAAEVELTMPEEELEKLLSGLER